MFGLWLTSAGVLLFIAVVFALAEICVVVDGPAREKRKKNRVPMPQLNLQAFMRDSWFWRVERSERVEPKG